jgi:CRISPR/Cas system-associated endonuclease/helicase Cas3
MSSSTSCISLGRHPDETCCNCKRWRTEGVKVRKSRWNAGAFRFKCDHGPHTEEFYQRMGHNDSIYDGRQKRSGDAYVFQTTPKRRAPPEYEEKDSDEFKTVLNMYTAGHYNNEMEVVDFDNLSDVSSSNTPTHGRGCPDKAINYRSSARFAQRNHELTATVRDQEKALVALSSSRREMDDLKIKAAALEEKNARAADKLVEAQEQVDAAMAEASVARDFLRVTFCGTSLITMQQKSPKMQ